MLTVLALNIRTYFNSWKPTMANRNEMTQFGGMIFCEAITVRSRFHIL